MDEWVEFYERTMGFTNIIHFDDKDIHTEYSALMSKVMANGEGRIKFPINEPAEGKRKSQIDEYLEFYGGPGVQHVALQSRRHRAHRRDAAGAGVASWRCRRPTTRTSPIASARSRRTWTTSAARHPRRPRRRRLPAADLHEARAGPADAVLRGDPAPRRRSFGKGNFKALFEAIEREQALRGNL